jgi:carbonic anhydrase
VSLLPGRRGPSNSFDQTMRSTHRQLLTVAGLSAFAVGAIFVMSWFQRPAGVEEPFPPTDPDSVLARLRAGNLRYVMSQRVLSSDTRRDSELRHRLTQGQHPFAALLCCSDSRLCPEFIFDQPAGSLFEIRNAGNVVEDDALASLEYAVEHLHVRFVFVLGHKGCGAIEAVVTAGDQPLHNHLRDLQERMKEILPRAQAAHSQPTPALLNRVAKENACEQARILLKESEPIRSAVRQKEVRLMFAIYDMESGEVEYFELP